MKNSLLIVAVVVALATLCIAANTASSPAAPAGAMQLNTMSPTQSHAVSAQASIAPGEGSPIPYCPPPGNCKSQINLVAGEGSPIPYCPPPGNCIDQLQFMAGEGSPIPYCPPHQDCVDQLRLMAGEGSPIPYCPPHQDCIDQLRLGPTPFNGYFVREALLTGGSV